MYYDNKILIGKSEGENIFIYPKMANRHGLIAGATGTGKTVTLKVLAESFSDAGVPVFMADVKGDLASTCCYGEGSDSVNSRIEKLGLNEMGFDFSSYPVNFWDVYQKSGMPLRTTISEMGPLILSRVLKLNETQTELLTVIFKIADDQGLLLIDTKDLKAMLNYAVENADTLGPDYGNIQKASINTIIRAIVALESEGGEIFFGEPALNIADWFSLSSEGKGTIQILDCRELINHPSMYAAFMLWMISELFESLPEVGDPEKPRMVFFFDEAHLLFNDAPKMLLEKIEQTVKLIRSKGVGIYFITQTPKDIPDGVLSQLGNKIQHALHAYTPSDIKAVKAAAQSFRVNPAFDTKEAIESLGIGEALVSVLDEAGTPTMVEITKILPPQSQMGALEDSVRNEEMKLSLLYTRYIDYFDRDSAYEFLKRQSDAASLKKAELEEEKAKQEEYEKELEKERKEQEKELEKLKKEEEKAKLRAEKEEQKKKNASNKVAKNVATTTAGTIGREVGKTVGKTVGGKFGKTLGGNIGASLGRSILGTFFK